MNYFAAPLTNIQLEKPNGFCESKIEKHLKLDCIEAKVLDANSKNSLLHVRPD